MDEMYVYMNLNDRNIENLFVNVNVCEKNMRKKNLELEYFLYPKGM